MRTTVACQLAFPDYAGIFLHHEFSDIGVKLLLFHHSSICNLLFPVYLWQLIVSVLRQN